MAFYPGLAAGGNNPLFGRDDGPSPPNAHQGGGWGVPPVYYQNPYGGGLGWGGYGWALPQAAFSGMHGMLQHPWPLAAVAAAAAVPGDGRFAGPAPAPAANAEMPAINMMNTTGGVGCEPGYNYFFPAEHTKIHVLKCGATPPWQLPAGFVIDMHAAHVPVNVTVRDLMKGFGANNPDKKKNCVHEVVQGGNGRWYRGMSLRGDDKDMMKKEIGDIGWDKTRTGLPGGKPVVYLYITKD